MSLIVWFNEEPLVPLDPVVQLLAEANDATLYADVDAHTCVMVIRHITSTSPTRLRVRPCSHSFSKKLKVFIVFFLYLKLVICVFYLIRVHVREFLYFRCCFFLLLDSIQRQWTKLVFLVIDYAILFID